MKGLLVILLLLAGGSTPIEEDSVAESELPRLEDVMAEATTAPVMEDSGIATKDVRFTVTGPRDLVEVEEFLRGATFFVQEPEPQARGLRAAAEPEPVVIRRTFCADRETPAQCPQPKTYQHKAARTPFDAPVTAGGETPRREWIWIKAGDATVEVFAPNGKITRVAKQCTAAEKRDGNAYQQACAAKVGQPLYITKRWRDEVVR